MSYTLAKAFVWLVLAGVLGIVIGWLLRSVAARRQISKARSQVGDRAEVDRLRARVAELEAGAAAGNPVPAQPDHSAAESTPGEPAAAPQAEGSAPDRTMAETELGQPIERDDLKVIEGIGPSVEDLCHGIGIRTWSDLAATEPSLLRTMLTDAGPRFKMQDPSAWPQQAELLADGRWAEFRDLVAELRNGSAPN